MTVFATALATLHADPNMAQAASFRHPPYAWESVRVILSQPNDAFGTVRAGALQADMLSGATTDAPVPGDELRIGGTTYVVESAERDVLALSWRLILADHN